MCNSEATSVEHAPPKCIFPRQRDLPEGVNLRDQLITVPSCDEHNQNRSQDDEYLLYSLVINVASNEIAQNHFFAAIMRAINRNPALIQRYTRTAVPVTIEDPETGERADSFAVSIEYERFEQSIDNLARAIYFQHYQEKLLTPITIQPEIILRTLDPAYAHVNAMVNEISRASDVFFENSEFHGNNPGVFKYQIDQDAAGSKMMRLHFYDNAKITTVL